RVFLHIEIVEPDRAELQAGGMKQCGPVAHDQLDGPTADVYDEHVALSELHALPDAQIDQTSLFQARDHADTDARFLLDGLDQVAAVGGFADGAGRDGLHPREPAVAGQGGEGPNHLDPLGDGVGRELPGLEGLLTQAWDVLNPVQNLVREVRLDFRQDHVNGVAADVEEGEFQHRSMRPFSHNWGRDAKACGRGRWDSL